MDFDDTPPGDRRRLERAVDAAAMLCRSHWDRWLDDIARGASAGEEYAEAIRAQRERRRVH